MATKTAKDAAQECQNTIDNLRTQLEADKPGNQNPLDMFSRIFSTIPRPGGNTESRTARQ